MSNAFDPFIQVRDYRGALPVDDVELVDTEGIVDLLFKVGDSWEAAKTSGAVVLENLASVKTGDRMRKGVVALARKSGPLFGRGAKESYESWQLAVLAAQRALRFQSAIQEADISIAQDEVIKLRIMKPPRMRNGCSWFATSFMVNAGGGSDYVSALPTLPWAKKIGERRWALVGIEKRGELLNLTVGIADFTFDARLADVPPFMQALKRDGMPAIGIGKLLSPEDRGQAPFIAEGELEVEKLDADPGDLYRLKLLLNALTQAHIKDARFDIVKSSAKRQYLAFPSLLSWMWFDFAQRKGRLNVAVCPECGTPFSRRGRSAKKKYCSAACRTRASARGLDVDALKKGIGDE